MDRKPKYWWWNGRWGRLARRDIKIFPDEGRYRVEAWTGGGEGRVQTFDDLDESNALALAEDLATDSKETLADWRDMVRDVSG